MHESHRPDHDGHDRLLVVRFASLDDDLRPSENAQARELVEHCSECATLVDDIRHISAAIAAAPMRARPRDFRLTAEQAASLRGSPLSRLLARLAGPGASTVLRPLAGAAVAIGLVLAVVGTVPALSPAVTVTTHELAAGGTPVVAGAPVVGPVTATNAPAFVPPETPAASKGAVVPGGAGPAFATAPADRTSVSTAAPATQVNAAESEPPPPAPYATGAFSAATPGAAVIPPPSSGATQPTEEVDGAAAATTPPTTTSSGSGQAALPPSATQEPVAPPAAAPGSGSGGMNVPITLLGGLLLFAGALVLGLSWMARRSATDRLLR